MAKVLQMWWNAAWLTVCEKYMWAQDAKLYITDSFYATPLRE